TRPKWEEYQEGDLIMVLKKTPPLGPTKLRQKWDGPYIVRKRLNQHSYLVQATQGKRKTIKVNVTRTCKFRSPPGYSLIGAEEPFQEVEAILDVKETAGDERKYLISWKGGTASDKSWVRERDVQAPEKVREFWARRNQFPTRSE